MSPTHLAEGYKYRLESTLPMSHSLLNQTGSSTKQQPLEPPPCIFVTGYECCAISKIVSVDLEVIPMLPRRLCEDLCSLNPQVDRCAFSVVWELSPDGQVLDEWFGRTVIRSCWKVILLG